MLIAASCSNDFTEQVNQGAEIGFNASVGGPTRATEVVLSTLGDFKVHAHSVSHNGDIYETPLIDNMTAKKSQTVENLWALDGAQVYWPSDVPSIKTWAYYPADLTGVTMNYANQNIANYSPKKSADAANKNDGAVQQDVLVAYTNAERSNGTSIDVTFKHALCHVAYTPRRVLRATRKSSSRVHGSSTSSRLTRWHSIPTRVHGLGTISQTTPPRPSTVTSSPMVSSCIRPTVLC